MHESELLNTAAADLLNTMDGMPGCFLRPHMNTRGKQAYRLLDKSYNPIATVNRSTVEALFARHYIDLLHSGDGNIYYMRNKRKYVRTATDDKPQD